MSDINKIENNIRSFIENEMKENTVEHMSFTPTNEEEIRRYYYNRYQSKLEYLKVWFRKYEHILNVWDKEVADLRNKKDKFNRFQYRIHELQDFLKRIDDSI